MCLYVEKEKKKNTQMAYHARTLVDVLLIDRCVILDKCCLRLTINFDEDEREKRFLRNGEIQYSRKQFT